MIFFCRVAPHSTIEMARTKNDFAWFNGARLGQNDVARPDWFALVYWPMVVGLYLVLTRGARLDKNAALVKVRAAAQGMLVQRRHEWQMWRQSLVSHVKFTRRDPLYGPGF